MSDIGSLVIVNIPFTDRFGSKNRPGVVVAEYLQDYQIVYMTKKVDKYLHESSSMQIGNEDISEGKLRQTSLIRAHKTNWVEKKSCKLVGKLKKEFLEKLLRKRTFVGVKNYYQSIHKPRLSAPFIPGTSRINYAGRVFDSREMCNLVQGDYLRGNMQSDKADSGNLLPRKGCGDQHELRADLTPLPEDDHQQRKPDIELAKKELGW